MIAKVLTEAQILEIHHASVCILEETGVVVPHEEVLSRFDDFGAAVNRDSQTVRIPPDLVSKLLADAGREFTLYGRDLTQTAEFGHGRRNYNSVAGEAMWVDSPGEDRRYTSLDDVRTAARFADALPTVTIPGAMADPYELPVSWRCVAVAAEMIRHTRKPITFWYHDRGSAKFVGELIAALRGSTDAAQERPICFPLLEPISPLRFPFNGLDLLFETSSLGQPVVIGPMAQMGLTAPMTVAGTMALENAEILAGICITQLVRPGLPVCYGGICHAFDMRTTQMIFGGPEQAVFGVGMTQMGKHYGLPVYINVGLTDSKRPDAQAGLECGVSLAYGAAAGADIFGHMGICGVDQASSLDMLVLQDEVISFVESANRELDCSTEALARDLVNLVGSGGTFIDKQHTVDHMRAELWFPQILDRSFYAAWQEGGAKNLEDRCRQRKLEIQAREPPEPLPDDIDREFTRIVRSAENELGE